LVKEWRTIPFKGVSSSSSSSGVVVVDDGDCDDMDFNQARVLLPRPVERPVWKCDGSCKVCGRGFGRGSGLLRHHCRLCGESFCGEHSAWGHCLPHLGYDPEVRERVCEGCKAMLVERELAERVAWRLARCRDYFENNLTPYFETGVDTMEDAALRIAQYTIKLTRQIPLGAQATVAIETLEVLRSHGLKGIYALVLRKDFMAAADLLCKVAGINEKSWPLSVHELSASVFYALAQHRWLRGVDPNREEWCHAIMEIGERGSKKRIDAGGVQVDETDTVPMVDSVVNLLAMADYTIQQKNIDGEDLSGRGEDLFGPFMSAPDAPTPVAPIHQPGTKPSVPVCTPLPTPTLCSLLFYAPLALEFIYVLNEVDMQLLAAQQGWNLLYAHLEQLLADDRPASALFVHEDQKIACFSVRGTATVQDVVTDIRAIPIPFPEPRDLNEDNGGLSWDILDNPGFALSGMAHAANHLFRENVDVFLKFVKKGYRIRIVGHSLGGGVAALLGILMRRTLEQEGKLDDSLRSFMGDGLDNSNESDNLMDTNDILRVYSYGTPACIDAKLADYTSSFITSVVLHDDVIPRLTPTSIRKLVKHLLFVRETWVKAHLNRDVTDVVTRVTRGWAPRWRCGFVLLGNQRKTSDKGGGSGGSIGAVNEQEKDKNAVMGDVHGEAVDGEMFFEAEEALVESDDEDEFGATSRKKKHLHCIGENEEWDVPFDEEPCASPTPPVLLEETPLPRLYIPGKIAHIYTHNGGYKATYVPRSFRELRRISLAANMLTDHKTTNYYTALLEVKSIRKAAQPLPTWTGFTASNTCSNCASRFTWASTCDSEAQEARDKHNCRSCGYLVCGPCSTNCVPLPEYGITVPVRICDSCYHDMGAVLGGCRSDGVMTRSFIENEEQEGSGRAGGGSSSRGRSMVNDLAERVYSSSFATDERY